MELHSIILIADAHRKIMQNKLDAAEEPTFKALKMAEQVFGPDNPGLVKALRACAMLREHQKDMNGAKEYCKRAYTVVYGAHGILHPGVQLVIDEYTRMLMATGNLPEALEIAGNSFEEAKKAAGSDNPVTIDCAQRLSQVLCRSNDYDAAETLMEEYLHIRVKKFGPETIAVAAALASLASVRENMGKIDDVTVGYLTSAIEIFHNHEGESNNFKSACGLMNKIQEKRRAMDQTIKHMEPDKAPTQAAKAAILMNNAHVYFKEEKFSTAERSLEEALEIFLSENGPEHPTSKAAAQNLGSFSTLSLPFIC